MIDDLGGSRHFLTVVGLCCFFDLVFNMLLCLEIANTDLPLLVSDSVSGGGWWFGGWWVSVFFVVERYIF